MILSISISMHSVTGIKVDENNLKIENFSFLLPFSNFKQNNRNYYKNLIDKVYRITNTEKEDTKLFITIPTENYLYGSDLNETNLVFNLLNNSEYPVIYIGDYKGYINSNVLPLVINPTDFYKWFHLAESINEVENAFFNRKAYGLLKPTSEWALAFEESLFREKLSFIFENVDNDYLIKNEDLMLTGEGLLYAGDDKRILLSFLDSIKIEGFWRVYIDKFNAFTCIYALNKSLSNKLFEKYSIPDLAGCAVFPNADLAELKYVDGETISIDLEKNSISVIPLNKKDKIDLKIVTNGKKTYYKATGGKYGLIIDNRERPLLKDKNVKQRTELIDSWLSEVNSTIDFDKYIKNKKNENERPVKEEESEKQEKNSKKDSEFTDINGSKKI